MTTTCRAKTLISETPRTRLRDSLEWRGDPQYLRRKFDDHRSFLAGFCVLLALLGPALWVWDLTIDREGARETWRLRLLYLTVLFAALAVQRLQSRRQVALLVALLMPCGQWLFMVIQSRLDGGTTYGFAGFLYFLFFTPFLCKGFSLRVTVAITTLATIAPPLFALAGLMQGFQHDMYASLVLPGSVLVLLLAAGMGWNYQHRYLSERALEQASNTDAMTGVANRRSFALRLQQELSSGPRTRQPVSLLMLDIDHFKAINDTHGHLTGDRVICTLANLCREHARGQDQVGRLGGEEFAVLLPDTDPDGAIRVAQRLLEQIRRSVIELDDDQRLAWTASIGVATRLAHERPTSDRPSETLLARADAALYEAKQAGRDRIRSALAVGSAASLVD